MTDCDKTELDDLRRERDELIACVRLWQIRAYELTRERDALSACQTCGLPIRPEHDACRLSREPRE
jgi:hypothetical protein